jgi:hypothetical protein
MEVIAATIGLVQNIPMQCKEVHAQAGTKFLVNTACWMDIKSSMDNNVIPAMVMATVTTVVN